jgi:hypothetical protein
MKKTGLSDQLHTLWIPLGIAAAVLVSISIVGNVLTIGTKLGVINSWLELGFYAALILGLAWLLYYPLKVLATPSLRLGEVHTLAASKDYTKIKRLTRVWVGSGKLPPAMHSELESAVRRGSDLRPLVGKVIAEQKTITNEIIRQHALLVFVSTAVSQNGRLDAISVLSANFRMIGELVATCGYRPPFYDLARLYARIFVAALVADSIDDVDFEHVFGKHVTDALGAIPGLSVVTNSFVSGGINALVTLRIGHIAKLCLLEDGFDMENATLKQRANKAARASILPLAKDAAVKMPGAMGKLISAVFN